MIAIDLLHFRMPFGVSVILAQMNFGNEVGEDAKALSRVRR